MQLSIKYRPTNFSGVVGQSVTKRILVNSVLMDRVPQAILLSGIRGIGKTTIARIYAAALNCLQFSENNDACGSCPSCIEVRNGTNSSVLEIDAASYSGVDHVRELEGLVNQVAEYERRVIIIDEVHMLSKAAQAALLKLIEDPKRTVFILVTTDPQKLENTVVSRCLNLALMPISDAEIAQNVRMICAAENAQVSEEFVQLLSRLGGGSLRDVLQILDQMIIAAGSGNLDVNLLREAAGVITTAEYGGLADALDQKNVRFFMEEIARWYTEGVDLAHLFVEGVPVLLRDFTVFLSGIQDEGVPLLTGLPHASLSANISLSMREVKQIGEAWSNYVDLMKRSADPKVIWELFAVKVCCDEWSVSSTLDY